MSMLYTKNFKSSISLNAHDASISVASSKVSVKSFSNQKLCHAFVKL